MSETLGIPPRNEVHVVHNTDVTYGIKGSINYSSIKVAGVTSSGDVTITIQWPYAVLLLNGQIYGGNIEDGDTCSVWCEIGQIGVLGVDAAQDATILTVNSTVIENVANGNYIKLPQGADLYKIVAIDVDNSQVTIESGLVAAATALDSIEYVPYFVGDKDTPIELTGGGESPRWGEDTFDGSVLPPNKPIKVKYYNAGASTKTVRGHFAILT